MIKDVHFVRVARPGKPSRWYIYAWRGGPRVAMIDSAKRPRLSVEVLHAIAAAHDATHGTRERTLRGLARAWRSLDPARPSSPEWEALAPGTRKTWGGALDRIEEKWGDTPLALWSDPRMVGKVMAWRDSRAATPRAADIGVTVLRALLEYGRLRGMVARNVAQDIPQLYRNGQRAEIIWTEADMAAFARSAEELGRPQLYDGLRLAALTGLRRADLVTLTWDQVSEFAITKRALKRSGGKRWQATMPRIPALDALLIELKTRPRKDGVETVLVNSYGDPWTADGFGGSFNRVRDEAGIWHVDADTGKQVRKHLHDLRGTFCTRLILDTELVDREIAEIMAWSPDRVAAIRRSYVDSARVAEAMGRKMSRFGSANGHSS